MSDGTPASSPAAAPASAAPADGGAAIDAGLGVSDGAAPAAAPAPAQAAGERARGPDGKFLPGSGEAPAVEAPAAAARRKLALKIRGEDHALDLDDSTASALARLFGTSPDRLDVALQKSVAGDRLLKEGRQAQESAKRLLSAIQSDPEAALEQLGVDLDSIAYRRLQAVAAREAMTPEQREIAELKAQLSARAQAEQAQAEQAQQAQAKAAEEAAYQSAQGQVLEALQQEGLPRSHRTIRMAADVLLGALSAGVTLTPAQVAAELRGQLEEASGEYVGGLPDEALSQRIAPRIQAMPLPALVALLGPRMREVLQHTVEQHRAKAGVVRPPPNVAEGQDDGEPEVLTTSEAMARLRSTYR